MDLISRLERQAARAGLVLMLTSALLVSALLVSAPVFAQTPVPVSAAVPVETAVAVEFEQLTAHAQVRAALETLANSEPETIAEQIRLTEIPAPPFLEQQRAEYYLQQMQRRGLPEAYIDAEGNVIGLHHGTGEGPLLAIAAHLDTVTGKIEQANPAAGLQSVAEIADQPTHLANGCILGFEDRETCLFQCTLHEAHIVDGVAQGR